MKTFLLLLLLFIMVIISGCVSQNASEIVPTTSEMENLGYSGFEVQETNSYGMKGKFGIPYVSHSFKVFKSTQLEELVTDAMVFSTLEAAKSSFEKYKDFITENDSIMIKHRVDGPAIGDEYFYCNWENLESEYTSYEFMFRKGKVNVFIRSDKTKEDLIKVARLIESKITS